MKLKPFKLIPVLIALGVTSVVCLVHVLRVKLVERFENATYDLRVVEALKFNPPVATNLGFVEVDESSIDFVLTNRTLGYYYGLYWPRHVYGRVVSELEAQGAKMVAFDVIFGELRHDHAPVLMADGGLVESDQYFADRMREAGNVILAFTADKPVPALFATNALALADIQADRDDDGVLRQAKAFRTYRQWHPAFLQAEADPDFGLNDLRRVRIEPGRLMLPRGEGKESTVLLDKEGNFDVADFWGEQLPAGIARYAKPFTEKRVWHMGIVLGAQELKLDLDKAEVDTRRGRITLRGAGGVERVIPIDREGYFYVDWRLPFEHPALMKQRVQQLLFQERMRSEGQTNELRDLWRGKLVVIGSHAVGNDLNDLGATPLSKETWLVSKHWNVANSVITGRFVYRTPLWADLLLIVVLGGLAALATLELSALRAFGVVVLLAVLYVAVAVGLFVQSRCWLPIVLPVVGALVVNHMCLLVWMVFFEQAERRRVRSLFSRMVSPKIVNELLATGTLSLGGARREISVMFADVRGFTELTDTSQERAAQFVKEHGLTGAAAEACFDQRARETLNTVNLYLGLVADIVKKRDGTFDKYIGDCVMAFWGAPTGNPRHALACVQAGIEVQRAIYELNRQRAEENARREAENRTRAAAGLPPQPLLPVLLMGTGINTGLATAGLMGSSDLGQLNYTVFSREVNLASRLEGASGRGRIFISETTFEHLRRDDPALAASCIEVPERLKLKGFSQPVKCYEVPWQVPSLQPIGEQAIPQRSAGALAAAES